MCRGGHGCPINFDEADMRYNVSGRAPSILTAALALLLAFAMQASEDWRAQRGPAHVDASSPVGH
jgi:hypothetical protein